MIWPRSRLLFQFTPPRRGRLGNRVGALMAEPGEPATFRIGPLTFQTSIVRRIFAAYGQVKVVTDDNYYIFK